MYVVTQCPVCKGHSFQPYLKCIDHTVSHETFQLIKCQTCSFIITSPRPESTELGKYYLSDEYISHTSQTISFFDKIYKVSRFFTLRWKLNIIKQNLPHLNIPAHLLDYGCGTGDFLKAAKDNGLKITGVEPSPIARAQAMKLTGEFIHPSLPETQEEFDAITLWHVLEHIPELNEKIEALKNKLSKNGTMFIAVPNHRSLDAEIYQKDWAAYDVPRHLWHFNRDTMTKLLNYHSLHVKQIIPMQLDAFYVSMLSEKQIAKTNSIIVMIKGFLNGIRSNFGKNKNEYSSLIYLIKK